jgi:hypothetical protein
VPSPSKRRATKRRRSSITELSFHGINTSNQKPKVLPMCPVRNVTYVSGRSSASDRRRIQPVVPVLSPLLEALVADVGDRLVLQPLQFLEREALRAVPLPFGLQAATWMSNRTSRSVRLRSLPRSPAGWPCACRSSTAPRLPPHAMIYQKTSSGLP